MVREWADGRIPHPLQREHVAAALPPLAEQLDIVEATYRSMARREVEMPPKIGLHPRADSFLHAMPAYLRESDAVGMKWVAGYPANPERGMPFISGVLIVNAADTGAPLAIMDAAEITAARTAAASGVSIRHWAPAGWHRVAVLGCGEQARYHVAVVLHLNSRATVVGYDPLPERVRAIEGVEPAVSAEAAVTDADIVISAGPIVDNPTSPLQPGWLTPNSWLLLPIDFDFYVSSAAVAAGDLFVTDDVDQFGAYAAQGHFRDWAAPRASVGAALNDELAGERVIACNLGVAALDVAFALAVLEQRE